MSEGEVEKPVAKTTNDILSAFPTDNDASPSNIELSKKLVHDIIGTSEALLYPMLDSENTSLVISEKAPSETSEVSVNPNSNQDGPSMREQTSEGSVNTTESEDLSAVNSRELKSLLALSKEAKLDTNISRKRKSSDTRKKYKLSESSPKQGVTPKSLKVFHENRNIRYPVTAESELEMDFPPEDPIKNDESSNKAPKRKKSNVSDASVGGATDENSRKMSRKSLTNEIVMFKPNKDMFCWRCHRDGVNIACETCVRSYHQKCLKQTIGDPKHWPCPECVSILKAESTQTRSEAMKGMTLEHLCGLLKFAVNRMMQCPSSEPFIHPVNDTDFPEYKKYIIQPMDLTLLEKNIKENLYGSTQAFEADAKWILHNSIIFNSYQSKLTNVAKNIIKVCKQEMAEIENCPSCYLNANTKKNTWFIEVCPKPHLLVWAKLRGFPYWPGKAMTCKDGLVDVRFFGAHDKAWVPEKECYLYCQKDPNGFKQKRNDIEACIEELNVYVKNLKKIYGEFRCAPYKILIDPSDELGQLRIFLPDYKSSGIKHNKTQKRQSIDKKPDSVIKESKEEPEVDEKQNGETPTSPLSTKDEKIEKKEDYHSNNNKDTMDGYGTDDDALPEIDTERRNMLRYKNEKQTNDNNDVGVEADEDDTQVPSNIKADTVDSNASKGNIKTKGQLKFIPHRSFEKDASPQKRKSLEDRILSSPNLSRRNSEASNKSDSSRLSNISDKINRIDIPENMELSLGNDDAGGVSISENVSSSNSECSRSDNEFSVEIKKKPIQVDIENSEFTISPASKLKISDKLMKRLSDEDQSEPSSRIERIEEVKKNVLSEKKSHTDILIEKLRDTDQKSDDKPSTSTQEDNVPSTSTVDENIVVKSSAETDELMDTEVYTTVSKMNPSLSPNFIEEMASINSISSLPPTQLMEDTVSESSNKQEAVEDVEKESENPVSNQPSSKAERSNVEKKCSESEDESDNEVLSKFVNKDNLARKQEPKDSVKPTEKEQDTVISEPPKKKVCVQGLPKKIQEVDESISGPSKVTEKIEYLGEKKPEPKSSPRKKEDSRAAVEKSLTLKVLLEESSNFKSKEYRKPPKLTEHPGAVKPKTSAEGNAKADETDSKPAEASPVKNLRSESELTSTAKSPTILLIKKSNVEKKVSALENYLDKGKDKDRDTSVADEDGSKKVEKDKKDSEKSSKEGSVSPEKKNDKDKNEVVSNIIQEFQDDEETDNLDNSQIDNASIINIIHSSLKDPQSKTPIADDENADSSSKKPSVETSLKNKKRKITEGETDKDKPQKKILRFIPIETILSGKPSQPETNDNEKGKPEEGTSNPILLKSLQGGAAAVTRKPSTHMTSPSRSLSTQSSVQEFLTDEIKSEPESETDTSEPENLEAKKRYLSALNILEKTYEKEKAKPHEIRTRSKTEEKREKFKPGAGQIIVVDNLTRVIDHVAVNYSAQHDGEALPPRKKSDPRRIQTPQVSNKQEGEIYVKSFAKMIPKQRARKSFPCPNYAKQIVVRPAPQEVKSVASTVSATEPTATTVISSTPTRSTATAITSSSNSPQQQSLQNIMKTPPIQPAPEIPRAFIQNGTQPPPLETLRTTSGYIILQQPQAQQEVVLLPPNQTINYTTSGVTVPTQVLQMASCIVSSSPATIKNITWTPASAPKDPNVSTSQNYIPQNENSPQEPPSVPVLPTYKPATASSTTTVVTTLPSISTVNNPTTVSSSASVAPGDEQHATVPAEPTAIQGGELNVADNEEFGLLNSLVPGNVNRAVTELLRRPPPKLKPRPPGALSTSFCEGLPSSAGTVTAKINSMAHRLGDYFRGMLIETLDNVGKANSPEAVITSLKLEMESLKHKHNIELSEIEKNITTVLKDIQRSIVEDRERIVEETRAACEVEAIKRIEEAKSKQWCANCGKEAQFYCCWNTSYCDYPCQQKHWPQHMNKCTQNLNGSGPATTAPTAIRPAGGQQLILRPANAPPKGGVGRIFTKPLQKVYMNRNTVAGHKTMKVQTPSGTQLTVMETTPGNYQVVGSPITVRSTQAYTTIKTSNLLSVTTAASSSSYSNQQKCIQPKPATARVFSHTIPVTAVLDEDSE